MLKKIWKPSSLGGAFILAIIGLGHAQCHHPAAIQVGSVCYIAPDVTTRAEAVEFKKKLGFRRMLGIR